MDSNEIQDLKNQLAALQTHINQLEATAEPDRASRRGMLKLAGGAAVGAVASSIALGAHPASAAPAAADGSPITIGETNTKDVGSVDGTVLVWSNTTDEPVAVQGLFSSSANAFLVRDTPSGILIVSPNASSYPSAVAGYAERTLTHGVYGFSNRPSGYGVVAYGSNSDGGTGLLARGSTANLELYPAGDAPSKRSDAHALGEVVCDVDGKSWVCVTAGTPGTWRQLAGADTAGSFHAITPIRVYDSRQSGYSGNNGILSRGASRTISVKDSRSANGTVVSANAIPAGTTAVAFNITVASPTGINYLVIAPGGATQPETSIVNFIAGQNVANASVVGVNANREVTVWCGGDSGDTHFILDISGYYL